MNYYYLFFLWCIPPFYIKRYLTQNNDLINNTTNFINAINYILFYLLNLPYIHQITVSFYIYDLVNIIENILRAKTTIKKQLTFIVHHIVSIYILELIIHNHYLAKFIDYQVYLFELSNIAIYLTYYFIKININKQKLLIVQLFQLFWYSYFRIFSFINNIYTGNLYLIYENGDYICCILILLFLIMNSVWTFKLITNIINVIKKDYIFIGNPTRLAPKPKPAPCLAE
jgi:hypothetical protein